MYDNRQQIVFLKCRRDENGKCRMIRWEALWTKLKPLGTKVEVTIQSFKTILIILAH